MTITVDWGSLASTTVAIARGDHQISPDSSEADDEGGWLTALRERFPWLANAIVWIEGSGQKLMRWAVGKIKGLLSWTVSAVWGAFVTAKSYIWTFNINASDEALDSEIKSLRQSLGAMLGSAVGCGFGWAAGMLTAAGIHAGIGAISKGLGIPLLAFDKASMLRALKDTSTEALEEITSLLSMLARSVVLYVGKSWFTREFKNARRLIKRLAKDSSLPAEYKEIIDGWGATNAEPWSLGLATEEAIDDMDSPFWRNFVSNAVEEADECFIEAGYVYAANVDRIMAERNDMREAVLGTQQVVEITPDREAPNETIVVAGREQMVRTTVMSTLATHQLVANRDVGQIVGQPANEQMLQQAPITTLTLRIIYFPVDSPPYTETSMRARGVTGKWTTANIQIPYVDPGELTWEKIKRASGLVGRVKGRYRCYGYLAGRKIEVYAATEQQGEQWLKDLAQLSEARTQLTGIGFTRRANNPTSSNGLPDQYPSTLVHPAYATIVSQKLAIDRALGRATLQGNFTSQSQRIELWPDTEPAYTSEILQAMKQYHTPLETLGIGFRRP